MNYTHTHTHGKKKTKPIKIIILFKEYINTLIRI